jgi:hypothetical protein
MIRNSAHYEATHSGRDENVEQEFITLFYEQIVSSVIGGEIVTPKVRPFMRRKPGQKRRTVHVKGHFRHKAV